MNARTFVLTALVAAAACQKAEGPPVGVRPNALADSADQVMYGSRFTINDRGVRRADIAALRDRCSEGPFDLQTMFGDVAVVSDATLRGPDGEAGSADPVRLGASDLLSCTGTGGCTSGSVYLRSPQGRQLVLRVASVAGRTRVLRYEPITRAWVDR